MEKGAGITSSPGRENYEIYAIYSKIKRLFSFDVYNYTKEM
ncbi:hypothetical protein GCM10008910_46510 [Faecalicatena orotica]